VELPAVIAFAETVFFGTVGYFGVSFGLGSNCTDTFETGHRCDALQRWLGAGAIGQGLMAITALTVLLVAYRLTARRRRAAAVVAWTLIPLAFGWIALTTSLGSHSF
jgi:hypothetical protein